MSDVADIRAALRGLRARRRRAHGPWAAYVGVFALVFGLGALWPQFTERFVRVAVVAAGALWLGCMWSLLFGSIANEVCPRCSKPFHMGPRYRNDFARRCLWCGLRLDGKNADGSWSLRV